MRIFIAGATGVLGRRVMAQACARGHEVIGLARSKANEETIRSVGGTPRTADIFDVDSLTGAIEAADVVIHAATAIPAKEKPSPEDWAINDRLRRDGTRALAEAAARVGAKSFVAQSIVWIANPPDDAYFDESSPLHSEPILQSACDLEAIARDAGKRHGYRVAILRGGMFYGADAAHTKTFRDALRAGRLPVIGEGDALWSCIHCDDAASAFVAATEAGRDGLWHVVDDEPVRVRDFLTEFAALLGARAPGSVPAWMAKTFAGTDLVKFFTRTTRTSNHRIREALGWSPKYPTYREGLRQVVAAWRESGELRMLQEGRAGA